MINRDLIVKSITILLVIIIGSVILVRGATRGQTLSDYAEKNNIPIHSENMYDSEGDSK